MNLIILSSDSIWQGVQLLWLTTTSSLCFDDPCVLEDVVRKVSEEYLDRLIRAIYML